ncbi:MAG: hypothetical protein KU38_12735 [Sulfurovum sp. FS08-3]|nr:MAG: hypothetical protein KU38_12735 [Sulfurovum sp. FS08-3]
MRILMAMLLLSFCLIADNNLTKVSLQLKWKHQFQFAGFYVAKIKGFYKEVGLEVEIKEFEHNISVVDDVVKGVSHFGVDDSQLIYFKLRNYPITALFAIFQDSPLTLLTTSEHNITKLSDFHNKIIEFTDNQTYETTINTLFSSRGITVKKTPPSFGVDELIARKVDGVISYLSNEPYLLEQKGFKPVTFSPKDYGIEAYGDMLFTSIDFAQKHPKVVEKFYQASKKGWEYAFNHIDESVDILYKHYNTQNKTKAMLLYEANALKALSGINQGTFGKLEPHRLELLATTLSVLFPNQYDLKLLDDFIYHPKMQLTQQESAYIAQKRSLTICYSPTYYPVLSRSGSEPVGIAIDYLQEIQKRIPLEYHYVAFNTRQALIDNAQKGHCDLIPIMLKNPNLYHDFLTPTHAYINDHLVVVTPNQTHYVDDLSKFKDLRIGMSNADRSLSEHIKKLYPRITFVELQNDSLSQIVEGKVDAIVTSFIRATYHLPNYPELKILMRISDNKLQGSMGVNANDAMLLTLLNKALDTIPNNTKSAILSKYHINKVDIQRVTDYTILYRTIGLALVVVSIILGFYFQLKKRNTIIKKLNENLEAKVKEAIEEVRKKDQMLQQQSKLAQMGEMISMIAHQWRQPLSSMSNIVANLQIKLLMQPDKQEHNYSRLLNEEFKAIMDLIQNLSSTIDDFRSFYKPSKAKQVVTLQEPIKKALNIVNASLEAKEIAIKERLSVNRPIALYTNEIIQVILNIIKNSEDNFIEKKTPYPLIEISTTQEESRVIITLCDNGGGIDSDILNRIFDPYFSTKSDKNGTGLGLYMSKIIIEEHHKGKLEVYNQNGGVCFRIILDIALS